MKQTTRLSLCAAALAFFSSCFVSRETTNVPLSPDLVAQLQPGQTTAQEVVELLGAPSEVVQLGFRSAWRYDYVRAKRAGFSIIIVSFLDTDARADRVWVFFDEQDMLTNVGSTFEAGGSQYQMPWFERDYPETDTPAIEKSAPEASADSSAASTSAPASAAK